MTVPNIIAYDVETNGLEFYRDDFSVVSASFAWRTYKNEIKTKFIQGQENIEAFLKRCEGLNMVCHNYGFEGGVNKYAFPNVKVNVVADTIRLVQQCDSGFILNKDRLYPQKQGLGLEASVSRWLPFEYHDHKREAFSWIRENVEGVRESEIGRHLMKLPLDLLERYNNHDAIVTLLLYETLTEFLKQQKFDWRLDHQLYMSSADLIIKAKARGVRINREKLKRAIEEFEKDIESIYNEFNEKFKSEIYEIIRDKELAFVNDTRIKTEKGREKRKKAVLEGKKEFKFNPNSTKDLASLFIGKLKMEPRFLTKPNKKTGTGGGSPSFATAHLPTWKEGGLILKRKGSLNFALNQAKNLLKLSEYDSLWHLNLFPSGTATGRFTGRGNQ